MKYTAAAIALTLAGLAAAMPGPAAAEHRGHEAYAAHDVYAVHGYRRSHHDHGYYPKRYYKHRGKHYSRYYRPHYEVQYYVFEGPHYFETDYCYVDRPHRHYYDDGGLHIDFHYQNW